jgi:hypothetical protein
MGTRPRSRHPEAGSKIRATDTETEAASVQRSEMMTGLFGVATADAWHGVTGKPA